MNSYDVPAHVVSDPEINLTDLLLGQLEKNPNGVLFAKQDGDDWTEVSVKQFYEEVVSLAKGLIASGIQPGQAIAILSRTRYEWTLIDFAIWFAGAVSVPIYESSAPSQIEWILSDSDAVAMFVENSEHVSRYDQVKENAPKVTQVWTIDEGAVANLSAAGSEVSDEELEQRRAAAEMADIATIIYTSGTTGNPKGCELQHRGFIELCKNGEVELPEIVNTNSSTLMFLPLAHVLGRFVSILCVHGGMKVGHLPDSRDVAKAMPTFKPTFLLAVPRVFEKVYNNAELKAEAGGKGKIFRRAAEIAIAYSKSLDNPGGPSVGLKIAHKLFDRLVYSKLRAALGGRVEYAISGGAPLGARLGHFYRGIGLIVLEGYGLTETYAPATLGRINNVKIGKVGYPIPGTGVKIADDGEILLRGYNILRGYWKNETATENAIEDGWLHTGDIGELDADGFLSITGRKKEILVTAGGKNVAPAALEDPLRAHPLIGQAVVIGDQKPFVAALISLDPEMVPIWAKSNGIEENISMEQAISDPRIIAEVQARIDFVNKSFSQAEQIKKFGFIDNELTEASGHLTPSLKVKRERVLSDYAAVVTEIYS